MDNKNNYIFHRRLKRRKTKKNKLFLPLDGEEQRYPQLLSSHYDIIDIQFISVAIIIIIT